jgi:ATP adenylyltransferase
MSLDRLWAGWRADYVRDAIGPVGPDDGCVMCRLAAAPDDDAALVVARATYGFVVCNAYPYTSGHLMVVVDRHEADLEHLDPVEAAEVMGLVQWSVAALKRAYAPDGVNVGVNLGVAAGAGVPGHLHVHVLPRWHGDTNFTTTVAEVRVVPESLPVTLARLREAWG